MNCDGSGVWCLMILLVIDIEFVFMFDGLVIYFVSDCGGSLQIYCMLVQGGLVQWVIFIGNYNISLDILFDGCMLVYIMCVGGNLFKFCVMDLVSGSVNQIIEMIDDESLSFVLNGWLIVYVIWVGGCDVFVMIMLDGKIKVKLIFILVDVCEFMWGLFGQDKK